MSEPLNPNSPEPETLDELKRDRDTLLKLFYQSERAKEEFKDMDFEALFAMKDQLVPFNEETL